MFGQPDLQHFDGLPGQRGGAVLAALAVPADVRSGAEVHVGAGETGQLGDAQPGLAGEQQQRVVAASEPGGAVGCG